MRSEIGRKDCQQDEKLIEKNLQEANYQPPVDGHELVKRYQAGERYFANAVLPRVDLSGQNLAGANLEGSDLRWASLQSANLDGANLRRSRLLGTTLRDANLQDADLTRATGLEAAQLAAANLSRAKLSEAVRKFDSLTQAEQISKIATKLFISIILGCVYSWLTIATTTDIALITSSTRSRLPIIQTEVPIIWFYRVAPILLVSLYLYFHLHLQRLWEGLANLPAIFPDGRSLDKTVYPWLLNGLVRSYFTKLREKCLALSRLQNSITVLFAWWLVPITLFFLWGRYLPRHDWFWTGIHIVLLALSIAAAISLHRLAAATLSGTDIKAYFWKRALADTRTYKGVMLVSGIGTLLYVVSFGAIDGARPEFRFGTPAYEGPQVTGVREWVPKIFAAVGYSPFADLRGLEISTKPESWRGTKEDLEQVKGANLDNSDLRYANMHSTFLAKADLRGSKLQSAYFLSAQLQAARLFKADLREAYLAGADLRYANLMSAKLQGTHLTGAQLQAANLMDADLRGANLTGAQLQEAKLQGTTLEKAYLEKANLSGADLEHANGLTQEQVNEACIDKKTKLPNHIKRPKPKVCPKIEKPEELW